MLHAPTDLDSSQAALPTPLVDDAKPAFAYGLQKHQVIQPRQLLLALA